jgi:formamidopyrimidine-DNA glycosylase
VPELPEVETVRRSLLRTVLGRRIARVEIRSPHCWQGPRHAVEGRSVIALGRRGKHLVLGLEGGWALTVHLRMTGRLLYVGAGAGAAMPDRHVHAVLHLDGGDRLVFHDVRRFGRMAVRRGEELAASLPSGRDPVEDGLDAADLTRLLRGRRGSVKALLLRQDVLAGLGNIYADEALWRARVHPLHPAGELGPGQVRALAAAIRGVLAEAIRYRGTTLADFRDARGEPGGFGPRLAVYGREGQPCRRCGSPVRRQVVAGRSSFFCPRCQAPPEGAAGGRRAAGRRRGARTPRSSAAGPGKARSHRPPEPS